MEPEIPTLEEFGLSKEAGFLPQTQPLLHLPDPYYAQWENIAGGLQSLLLTKRVRKCVDEMDILSTEGLHTEPEWRRAYSLLGFILHAYIWQCGSAPADRVPPSLSIPLLEISDHLGLPPVATYAGLVLWNFKSMNLREELYSLNNLATLHTFTGGLDEMWFYLVSVALEASGGKILHDMLEATRAARNNNTEGVLKALQEFVPRLDEIGVLVNRMQEECDPSVFYYHIRPLLAGSKNMSAAGLPHGVIYDTGKGDEEYRQYGGGSNAQSSLIQFIDLVLGVEHGPTGRRPSVVSTAPVPAPASAADATTNPAHVAPPAQNSFIHESRMYMPREHRNFLERVAMVANIKQYVRSLPENKELTVAYDNCIKAITNFRNVHMNIVHRYITNFVGQKATWIRGGTVAGRMNLALASTNLDGGEGKPSTVKGTGGSDLAKFLRQTRDETTATAIVPFVNKNSGLDKFLEAGRRARAERLREKELALAQGGTSGEASASATDSDTAVEGSDKENAVEDKIVDDMDRMHIAGSWPSEG